jgi:hypothetical protein
MVGLSDIKTEAGSNTNIRNRTSRLNRSSEAMKSAKENGYDSSEGGATNHKRGVGGIAAVRELEAHQHAPCVEESQIHNNQSNRIEQLMLEESSSTQSNSVDPYDMMIHQQPAPHRTPRQHQMIHHKPPHHVVPIAHNRQLEESKETSSPKRWGKNIEESISGILKRLDQLAADREQHGTLFFIRENTSFVYFMTSFILYIITCFNPSPWQRSFD